MPLSEARRVADGLENYLRGQEAGNIDEELQMKEEEFERHLLSKGIASHIATGDETDEEFNAFELIEVEGESLSETILRERR